MNSISPFFCSRRLMAATNFFWLIAASQILNAAEPLLWKFVAGEKINYQMSQEMEMTMDLGPGGETVSSVKQVIDMVWEINAIQENGNAVLTQSIRRVRMEVGAPGQAEVKFDSASDEPPQGYAAMLTPMFEALIGAPFQVTITPRGQIVEVEIPESLLEAMSQVPGGAIMGSLATEEGFRNTVRQISIVLPKSEELTEGHQWTTTLEMENPATGKITSTTTYQYKGSREHDGQLLEVFVPTIVTQFGKEQGNTIKLIKEESTGEILFNRTTGRLRSSTIHQLMDTAITVGERVVKQHLDQTIAFQQMPEDEAGQ